MWIIYNDKFIFKETTVWLLFFLNLACKGKKDVGSKEIDVFLKHCKDTVKLL